MALTNNEAQDKLEVGLAILRQLPQTPKVEVAITVVTYIKAFSASGNSIPGLRGLGLEETLAFVETLQSEKPGKSTISTRKLAQALQIET